MRVIIIAAGDGTRWGNYKGVPKHLVPVNGEILLHRTVGQFTDYADVVVVGRDGRYDVRGSRRVKPVDDPDWDGAAKFLSSMNEWVTDGRTVILYGDVWFSDDAVDTIVNHTGTDWTLFARANRSTITGTDWGECFAISFYPQHHTEMHTALLNTVEHKKRNATSRCGGWELYRLMTSQGIRGPYQTVHRFVEIDDFTDDFDYPDDLDRWHQHWNQAHMEART